LLRSFAEKAATEAKNSVTANNHAATVERNTVFFNINSEALTED